MIVDFQHHFTPRELRQRDAARRQSIRGSEHAMKFGIIRDTFGEVYPSVQINFGMMKKARAHRSLELFARHVMPRFR